VDITEVQRIALDCKWWTYGRNKNYPHWKAIDVIWTEAFIRHYWPAVENVLKQNEKSGGPTKWSGLARRLGIHEKSMPRMKQEVPDTDLRMAIASYLGEEESNITPAVNLVVATATIILVTQYHPPCSGPPNCPDAAAAFAYATYAFRAKKIHQTALCPATLDLVMSLVESGTSCATLAGRILDTAETVGRTLLDHFDGLP
jgi:hypothetical protein